MRLCTSMISHRVTFYRHLDSSLQSGFLLYNNRKRNMKQKKAALDNNRGLILTLQTSALPMIHLSLTPAAVSLQKKDVNVWLSAHREQAQSSSLLHDLSAAPDPNDLLTERERVKMMDRYLKEFTEAVEKCYCTLCLHLQDLQRDGSHKHLQLHFVRWKLRDDEKPQKSRSERRVLSLFIYLHELSAQSSHWHLKLEITDGFFIWVTCHLT